MLKVMFDSNVYKKIGEPDPTDPCGLAYEKIRDAIAQRKLITEN